MKKVLFLIPNLSHGGAEKVLVNLVNNIDKTRFDVTVMTLFDVGVHRSSLNQDVKYKYLLRKSFRGNSTLVKFIPKNFLFNLMVKDKYDIVVSYLEGPTSRILSGCIDPTAKKVAWIHIELNTPKLAALGFRTISEAKKAYRSFDKVVSVSKNVKDTFIDNIGENIPVEVLYNTNETDKILEFAEEEINDELFVNDDGLKICSVAKLIKKKGFDRLVQVHKRILEDGIRHKIYLLGVGEEQERLEKLSKELGVSDSIIFLGFKPNPYQYVARCDLYVCSSLREGFSTAVTEALVVGTPVVSTNCSGAKELLGDNNEYGIVVDNSEEGIYQGMKQILSDPELLARYKEQARHRGCYFSKEKTVKAVEDMLDNL